jgi:NAD+ synthase (glutamine-hydrolysing)
VKKNIQMAQIDTRVGNWAANLTKIVEYATRAQSQGAQILVLPELCLCGYPPEDLVFYAQFIAQAKQAQTELVAKLKPLTENLHVFFGNVDLAEGNRVQNAVFEVFQGEIVRKYTKRDLPNYGVFDEKRYFCADSSGDYRLASAANVAVAVCEDIWNHADLEIAASDEAIVVLNASPFTKSKHKLRVQKTAQLAKAHNLPVYYTNRVGGQDELVFDGGSFAVDNRGELLCQGVKFAEALICAPAFAEDFDELTDVYCACVLGLRSYAYGNGFSRAVLGLSGGIDSALCAAMAVDALGDAVGIAMPSPFSSAGSIIDAEKLAQNLAMKFILQPITDIFTAYKSLDSAFTSNLALENIQARIRGNFLMAYSNSNAGSLVLATGNKSELAVGYSTIYGDAVGGYAPIKDVYKTEVWLLARTRNAMSADCLEKLGLKGGVMPIPESSIIKPPSAELRPGQLDSDALPDYNELDAKLEAHIEGFGETDAEIERLVKNAQWKRKQYPLGAKITTRAFDKDFRMPITR